MKTRVTYNIVVEITVETTNWSPSAPVERIISESRQTAGNILRSPERMAEAFASGLAKVRPGETLVDLLLTGV